MSNSDRASHAGSGLKRLLRELCGSGRMRSRTALSKSPASGTCTAHGSNQGNLQPPKRADIQPDTAPDAQWVKAHSKAAGLSRDSVPECTKFGLDAVPPATIS